MHLATYCRFILSAESGNILVWNRLTEQVLYKEAQPGVKQLILLDNGQRFLAISRPEPVGDGTRVNASIVMRTIPGKKLHHIWFVYCYQLYCIILY